MCYVTVAIYYNSTQSKENIFIFLIPEIFVIYPEQKINGLTGIVAWQAVSLIVNPDHKKPGKHSALQGLEILFCLNIHLYTKACLKKIFRGRPNISVGF